MNLRFPFQCMHQLFCVYIHCECTLSEFSTILANTLSITGLKKNLIKIYVYTSFSLETFKLSQRADVKKV